MSSGSGSGSASASDDGGVAKDSKDSSERNGSASSETRRVYRRVAEWYRPFWWEILVGLSALLAATLFNLLKPWPIAWVIDAVIPLGVADREALIPLPASSMSVDFVSAMGIACGVVLGLYVLHGAATALSDFLLVRIGLQAVERLRNKVFARLQHLPLLYHNARHSGDSTYRVMYDAQTVQTFLNQGFVTITGSVLALLGAFVVMFQMNALLALISLGVVPILWLVIYLFAERVRRQTTALQERESDLLAHASETLGNIRVVQAFGGEGRTAGVFGERASRSCQANRQVMLTYAQSAFCVALVMAAGTATIVWVGADEATAGRITVGDLFIFLSYLAMLYQPLEKLGYTAWAMEGAAAGMERVFAVLDEPEHLPEPTGALPLRVEAGRIELSDVSFAYTEGDEAGRAALRQVDVVIEPGSTVAVVGGTGAGKSTLLALVVRLFDPDEGTVFIDGQDLRMVSVASVRTACATVFQDTLLLSGSIGENIAFGRPGASRREIEVAAQSARLHDFVASLPQGYDTPVGERGVQLSGGQRQRVGIARALLRDAPILLLDEPTSALDTETEAEVLATLGVAAKGCTTLLATHRVSAMRRADKILVLEGGRVVEHGTWDVLLGAGGALARLVRASHATEE